MNLRLNRTLDLVLCDTVNQWFTSWSKSNDGAEIFARLSTNSLLVYLSYNKHIELLTQIEDYADLSVGSFCAIVEAQATKRCMELLACQSESTETCAPTTNGSPRAV